MTDASRERWGTAGIAVAFCIPLLLCRYYPGNDLPWHVVAVSMLERGDPAFFLNNLQVDPGFSSYLLPYYAMAFIARVIGDAAIASQLFTAAYVIAFVLGARRLLRAYGASGWLCALAAPAAYCFALDFGFLPYAATYPLTLFLWAILREVVDGEPLLRRAVAVVALGAAIALSHPFGAALALGGGIVVLAPIATREHARRAGIAAAALIVSMLPAFIAVVAIGGQPAVGHARLAEGMTLWDKITYQDFTRVDESIGAIPSRLFGLVPSWLRWVMFAGGLAAARLYPVLCKATWKPRPAGLLAFSLSAVYLLLPFSILWPIYWYVVQPRALPLLWVVLIAVAAGGTVACDSRRSILAVQVAAAALVVAITASMWPFARETREFRDMVEASAPQVNTLALIEQPQVRDRHPPEPFRNFGAHLVAERGGWTSHLSLGQSGGGFIVPVSRPADAPALLAAPMPGWARTFDWATFGAGWDQILIRDADPAQPWDYFREYAGRVELVRRSGRWRLYRVRGR